MYNLIIPTQSLTGRPVNTIGLWLSGGADSSLLCYMLVKKIKEQNLNVKIQPITIQKRPGVFESIPVRMCIEQLLDAGDIFKPHIVYTVDQWVDNDYHKTFAKINTDNIKKGLYQLIISGITKNPPIEEQLKFKSGIQDSVEEIRGENINKSIIYYKIFDDNGHLYEELELYPFVNLNKKDIADLYKEYSLLDTLFPLTKSCENRELANGHCGYCWWCDERQWGFGRL